MDSIEKTQKLNLADILPNEWKDENGNIVAMQAAYACLFFTPKQLGSPYLTGRISDAFYLVIELKETVPFIACSSQVKVIDSVTHVEFKPEQAVTSKGTHIFFFAKCKEKDSASEIEAQSQIEAARGLICALEGLNATYQHVFTRIINLTTGETSSVSPTLINPKSLPLPFRIAGRVDKAASALDLFEKNTKARILLALRWFDKSDREQDTLDAFLKAWFAIEVLAMPNTTKIRPIVESLAIIYEKNYQDSANYFQVGRVADFRSNVVHKGVISPIHQQLQRYVQAIFVDILLHLTNQTNEKRTEAVLNDSAFPHAEWRP